MRALVLALALALPAPTVAADDPPRAPDGRRGIGAETDPDDVLALFRRPTDEDEAFLVGLRSLEGELAVLAEAAEALYRGRGWAALVRPDAEDDGLAAMHAAFAEALYEPAAHLAPGGARARALAEAFLDPRFRARLEVLEGWELDAREVRRGLDVLRAATDGWVRPTDDEIAAIAERVDLAAALLRARIRDLEALRETPGARADVAADEVDALLAAAARGESLAGEAVRAGAQADRMLAVLFTPRLRAELAGPLERRRARLEAARALHRDAYRYLPESDDEVAPPDDVARLSKTRRRRAAQERAHAGLAQDPLNDDLAYLLAYLARFLEGRLVALSHYDRFLALHGIRAHDDRTFRDRELDARERDALFYVQTEALGAGSPPPPDGGAEGGAGGDAPPGG